MVDIIMLTITMGNMVGAYNVYSVIAIGHPIKMYFQGVFETVFVFRSL